MSGIIIRDARSGKGAFVTEDNQLLTQAQDLSLQHYISRYRGQMYQCVFDDTGINSGTNVIGHITNNSTSMSLVLAYVRLQAVDLAGGTAVPSTNTYFSLLVDETYTSGGTATIPVNMNRASGNEAVVSAYDSNPTVGGTGLEIDRLYVSDEGQFTYQKEGSVILGPNDTLSIKLITDNTSGTGYAKISFMMMDLNA